MSGGNINPGSVAQVEPTHYAAAAGYSSPTTCGRTAQPKPAANDWRFVDCPACLVLATPAQRALREEQTRRYPAGGGGA